MIREVDEDGDNAISFREFLLIFRKSANGSLTSGGFENIIQNSSVDVDEVGVLGAKAFFEAKADQVKSSGASAEDFRRELEQKRREREEKAAKKKAFQGIISGFNKK